MNRKLLLFFVVILIGSGIFFVFHKTCACGKGNASNAAIKSTTLNAVEFAMSMASSTGSYKNLCSNPQIKRYVESLKTLSLEKVHCADSETNFIFQAYIPKDKAYWCADSEGNRLSQSKPDALAVRCTGSR